MTKLKDVGKMLRLFGASMIFGVTFLVTSFFGGEICTAQEPEMTEEATFETGQAWYITDNAVRYYVSDSTLAEIVNVNGVEKVFLKRPGDVFITVKNKNDGAMFHYLIHITGDPVDETAVNRSTFAQEVLDLVNIERQKVGAQPLRLADDLIRGAAIRAQEQAQRFSHTRPNGTPFYTVLIRGNTNTTLGENVAIGQTSPKKVMIDWMNSPGHRKNILNPQYKELGVGYYYSPNSEARHHWAQIFRR